MTELPERWLTLRIHLPLIPGLLSLVDEKKLAFNSAVELSYLNKDEQERFLNTRLLIYVCEGTEREIKDWFRTIKITGIP